MILFVKKLNRFRSAGQLSVKRHLLLSLQTEFSPQDPETKRKAQIPEGFPLTSRDTHILKCNIILKNVNGYIDKIEIIVSDGRRMNHLNCSKEFTGFIHSKAITIES